MREILFRGKDRFSREWEEGSLLVQKDGCGKQLVYICAERGDRYIYIECDPKTICQYSGFRDKAFHRIWEGDIITFTLKDKKVRGIVRYGEYCNPFGNGKHVGFYLEWEDRECAYFRQELPYWVETEALTVSGNIFGS